VIRKFRHKGLKRFFSDPRYTDKRGINPQISRRLIAILDALEVIEKADEMDIAGLYFHKLKGQRKDEFSVRVTGNWRITWRMDDQDVTDVNLEDYH
jgi:proteic killer suppression protein